VVYTDASAGQFANSEVWLPDEWNGRFMGIGNGGYGGGPGYEDMAYAGVYEGFASGLSHLRPKTDPCTLDKTEFVVQLSAATEVTIALHWTPLGRLIMMYVYRSEPFYQARD
jgi:hypothetical protein